MEVDLATETIVSRDVSRAAIREAGFEVHDGSFTEDDEPSLLLACMKPLE